MRAPTPDSLEQIDGALLEHAGAHAVLDVVAVAAFEHDGLDARAMQEMRQHEPRRARTEDADLRAMPHRLVILGRRSCARVRRGTGG